MKLILTIPVILCVQLFMPAVFQRNIVNRAITVKNTPVDSASRKTWIEDLRSFRDAVYKKDIITVKRFFSFPVLNPNNEIWYLVLTEKEIQRRKIGEKPVPFTEKDFLRYYTKLLPAEFTKTLLKIKTSILFTADETETPDIIQTDGTVIKMYARFEPGERSLSFNVSYRAGGARDSDDAGESNVIYFFRVLENGHLQFQKIMLAG